MIPLWMIFQVMLELKWRDKYGFVNQEICLEGDLGLSSTPMNNVHGIQHLCGDLGYTHTKNKNTPSYHDGLNLTTMVNASQGDSVQNSPKSKNGSRRSSAISSEPPGFERPIVNEWRLKKRL